MALSSGLIKEIERSVAVALEEDVGGGDITAALIPPHHLATATIITRESAVMCGQPWAERVFQAVDASTQIEWQVEEGQRLEPGTVLCNLSGSARSLLTAERAALNFLQTLMGVATESSRYADAVAKYDTQILDTRKTIPGLRLAQKYAVKTGGCANHRIGLFDAYLIKENHIAAAGGIEQAILQARQNQPSAHVEVEVETLAQLTQALDAGADIIMLDNFSLTEIEQAVAQAHGRAKLEVSGNVELEHLASLAATGVDFISTGALTKHVRAIDLSMRFSEA
ncbi:MAG: carboxylating nicotinate-nucleotide diphosphorylase [Gammaproteobacteria bacterium]|nr:carboxylating nicotinate-nucleotide diphosphorylase [Gammaproteobacteria bacterium]